ncbi:hypothetical protein ACOMHN_054712 [Nucella lapillus]
MFREKFAPVLTTLASQHKYLMIVGDVNLHFDEPDDSDTKQMCQLLDSLDLKQHVTVATQKKGHILDWVISRSSVEMVKSVTVEDMQVSDHFLVTVTTNMSRPSRPTKLVNTRNIKGMDKEAFRSDLKESQLVVSPPEDVVTLVPLYNGTLSSLLDTYAPTTQKRIVERPDTSWYTPAVRTAKKSRRRAERKWRKSGREGDRQIYRHARNQCSREEDKAIAQHVTQELNAASSDPKKMYSVVNGLLGEDKPSPVLPDLDDKTAADTLGTYFSDKIQTIRDGFGDGSEPVPQTDRAFAGTALSRFEPVTEEQLMKIIRRCNPTSSAVDPVPTRIVMKHLDILLPVLVAIINASLLSATIPRPFKSAIVKPFIKKRNLDPNVSKN